MAKENGWLLPVVAIVVVVLLMNKPTGNSGTGGTPKDGGVDLCKLVQSDAKFTAQRDFQIGTAVSTFWVKVIGVNGMNKDLGYVSLNSGTLSTEPTKKYKLYFGLNTSSTSKTASTDYYVAAQDYTAPCQDATDDVSAKLCQVGTPTITVFDEYGNVQSASANAQAMTTNDKKDVSIRVRAPSRQCVGAPDAKAAGLSNALCLRFNTTIFKNVQAKTGSISAPYAVSSVYSAAGLQINCFKSDVLADTEQKDYTITVEAQNAEATTAHNISVYFKDIDMDLNAQTLEPIWGFEDEDNNRIGATVTTGTLYIS